MAVRCIVIEVLLSHWEESIADWKGILQGEE